MEDKNIKFNFKNEDSIDPEKYIIDHYKMSESAELNQEMYDKLTELLTLFQNNPNTMMSSYILHDYAFISRVCDAKQKQLYNNGMIKLTNDWERIYDDMMNDRPVVITEKNRLFTFLEYFESIDSIDLQNDKINKCSKKLFDKLSDVRPVSNNSYERQFFISHIIKNSTPNNLEETVHLSR